MRSTTFSPSIKKTALEQLLLAGLAGTALFLLFVFGAWLIFQITYSGRIYPGVRAAGIDVSGLNPQAAAAKITQAFEYPQKGRIFLQDGGSSWKATPAELGLFLDASATARLAYQAGREGNLFENALAQIDNLRSSTTLPPVLVFDEQMAYRYLESLGAAINKPVLETTLGLNGMEVVVRQGQKGRDLDLKASLEAISKPVLALQDGIIPLVITETPPLVGDVTAEAELARKILGKPFSIALPADQPDRDKKGPWTIDQRTLAAMINIEPTPTPGSGSAYQVTLKPDMLRTYLKNLGLNLTVQPENARFIFNDDTRKLEVIKKAVIGRSLDLEGSIRAIRDQVALGNNSAALALTINKPPVTDDMTGDQLGIRELIHAETSYFYGSSKERVQNIKASSSKFHGLMIPPGATVSMSDILGDITLDNGYAEALIILNGKTIKGVGGGVCQVSTTLFRTAFFAGFPILERHAHAYRVSYYEKTSANKINNKMAGLDATVFVPLVDFRFKNDSSSWLLMETYMNSTGTSLTWKFYSTSDGRKIAWDTTGPVNVVEAPEPVYKENKDLAKGTIRQVEWAADGADVTVTRTVTRDGKTISKDTIRTHYVPWGDVYEYGPGTPDIPTPKPKE